MTTPDPVTLDIAVGVMVETPYGWKEYCNLHGASFLSVYPERRYRDASLYEVLVSSREYRCQACHKLLWEPEHHKENSNDVELHGTV